jgi:hypothetical protein
MKYTLIIMTLFMIHFSNAQTTIQKLNTATLDNIDSLFSSNLYTNTNGIKHIFTLGYKVKGDGGGAHYIWNPQSSLNSDSAFTIKPKGITGNGRWELIVDNGIVNFLQIRGVSNGRTDCKPVFLKFLLSKYSKLYIPANVENDDSHAGPYYYFSDSITINRRIEIFGAGTEKTILSFPNSMGIFFTFSSTGSYFHNIKLKGVAYGYNAIGYNNNYKHGIRNEGINRFEDVKVEAFDGDGFYTYGLSGLPYSNSSLSQYIHCTAFWNGRNGFTFKGPDANQCVVQSCNAQLNKRWGIADSSFLGNEFHGNHSATNGQIETGGFSSIVYKGYRYYCIKDHINKEPEIAVDWQTYWFKDAISKGPDTWRNSINYFTGGGVCANDPNHQGTFIGDYIEGDEVINFNTNNLIIGGFLARYGQAQAAIGVRQGVLTSRNFQAFYETNLRAQGIRMSADANMNFIGGYDQITNSSIGFKFNSSITGQSFYLNQNYQDGSPFSFISQKQAQYYRSNLFGRNTTLENSNMSQYGEIIMPYGYFMGGHNNKIRHIEYADTPPTSGYHGAGDVVENNGTDTTVIRWTCIKEGNPGTWVKIKSGN